MIKGGGGDLNEGRNGEMIPASWEIEYGEFFSASAADQLRKTKEMYEESRMNQQIEDNEEYLVGFG